MLQKLTIELNNDELAEFKEVLNQLTREQSSVEIKLNGYRRSIARMILKEIEREEDFRKRDLW
jgi:hypothetical protein